MTSGIPPFPANINRDYFGAWLSGFVDGEGCFKLDLHGNGRPDSARYPRARFMLGLRMDDYETVQLIQSFWECGRISLNEGYKLRTNPQSRYVVEDVAGLIKSVVPHFDRFPLLAKKARDFALWKQAVTICAAVKSRRRQYTPGRRGATPTWTEAERTEYARIKAAMESGRRYEATVYPLTNFPRDGEPLQKHG